MRMTEGTLESRLNILGIINPIKCDVMYIVRVCQGVVGATAAARLSF
jgi:hypothetical protein